MVANDQSGRGYGFEQIAWQYPRGDAHGTATKFTKEFSPPRIWEIPSGLVNPDSSIRQYFMH